MTTTRWDKWHLHGSDRLALAVAAFLLSSGCDLIPGSAAYEEKLARGAAAQLLIDPGSAQFRNVASRETAVCGEINGRNRMGAYVGFTRFWVDTSSGRAALDPGFDYDRLITARQLCASIGGTSCTEELELALERAQQDRFDSAWGTRCEGSAAGGGSVTALPWDPTAANAAGPEENWTEEPPPSNAQATRQNDASDEPATAEDVTGVDALNAGDANLGTLVDPDGGDLENDAMDED